MILNSTSLQPRLVVSTRKLIYKCFTLLKIEIIFHMRVCMYVSNVGKKFHEKIIKSTQMNFKFTKKIKTCKNMRKIIKISFLQRKLWENNQTIKKKKNREEMRITRLL